MKTDDLRRRAWQIRKLCIVRPMYQDDSFLSGQLPIALVKRFGLRLSEDLLCIYTLERRLGQGYKWVLSLSKKEGFQSVPKTVEDFELAARVFLNDQEMQSLDPDGLEFSDGISCGHAVTRCEFIPAPSEGYPAKPLPGKEEAVFDREEVDGPRKLIVRPGLDTADPM